MQPAHVFLVLHRRQRRAKVLINRSAGHGSERSIDVRITRLRRKIEADPKAPRHLQTVRGEGYVLWAS